MRIRRILVAGLLAAGVVAAMPSVAYAASDHNKEVFECVEKAIEDNTEGKTVDYTAFKNALDDCNKAKSLVTPAVPEIFWGGIAFLIVLAVLMKFAFPALKKGLKAREEKIRDDLESASRAREEAEAEAAQYRAQIGDARSEGNVIVEEARADAERIRREVVARAEAEAADIRERAQEDIRLAQERAVSDLRAQVADLSIGLAEKVVERNLDRDTQIALIESYINSVGNETR
ncbi:MAG: F0F1 ATP synthase subunit B [Acidimicrobiia bacterium]|jgi:F-type H+-transporting ATPase subunit b